MSKYGKRQPRYSPVRGRRAEFPMVEQRRREYLGAAPPASPAPARSRSAETLARLGAASALASAASVLVLSLGLAAAVPAQESTVAHQSSVRHHRVAGRSFAGGATGLFALAIPRAQADAMASLAFATREGAFDGAARASRAPVRRSSTARVVARAPQPEPSRVSSQISNAQPASASLIRSNAAETGGGFSLEALPWRLTPDGTWVTEVVASFADGSGERQPHLRAAVDFQASSADVLVLDPWIHQSPAALVTASNGDPVTVTATAASPLSASATLVLPPPPDDVQSFATTARAVGPHLIAVGWTPLAASSGVQEYKVYRSAGGAGQSLVSVVSPAGHTWRDAHVEPGLTYAYSVVAQLAGTAASASTQPVTTPGAMDISSVDAIAGKGMFLFFSPDTDDPHSYALFDPDAVVAQAQRAGVATIELRLSRGTFFEAASPSAHAWLDSLIDGAAAAGLKLVAWTVPRRNAAEDVAQSVAMAMYKTPAGNGFSGLALDLEPGTQYMGDRPTARERMADYMEMAREAVGPDYLLVATVISPRLSGFTNDDYPYSRIARYASAMQPMEYWHHYRDGHEYAQTDVSGQCADVVALTRSLAGRNVPVNVAGQSADLGRTGSPAPEELHWCLGAAKSAGAIGEMFFDWRATTPDQWAAIEAYRW